MSHQHNSASQVPSQHPSQPTGHADQGFGGQQGGSSPSNPLWRVNQNSDGQTFGTQWQRGLGEQPNPDLQTMWAASMAARSRWQQQQQNHGRQQLPAVAAQGQTQHGASVLPPSNVPPPQTFSASNHPGRGRGQNSYTPLNVQPPQTPSQIPQAVHDGTPTLNQLGSGDQNNDTPPA